MGWKVSSSGIAFILELDGNLIASSCSPNVKKENGGEKVRINAGNSGHALLTQIYNHLRPLLDENLQIAGIHTFIFEDSDNRKIHVAFEQALNAAVEIFHRTSLVYWWRNQQGLFSG